MKFPGIRSKFLMARYPGMICDIPGNDHRTAHDVPAACVRHATRGMKRIGNAAARIDWLLSYTKEQAGRSITSKGADCNGAAAPLTGLSKGIGKAGQYFGNRRSCIFHGLFLR